MPDNVAAFQEEHWRAPQQPPAPSLLQEQIEEAFLAFMHEHGYSDLALTGDPPMQLLTGGISGQTWRMNTGEGPFVISVAEHTLQYMKPQDVNHVEQYMFEQGCALPRPIGEVGHIGEAFFQVSEFVGGVPMSALPGKKLNDKQIENLGQALGKIHAEGKKFHREFPKELLNIPLSERMSFLVRNRPKIGPESGNLLRARYVTVGNVVRSLRTNARRAMGKHDTLPKGIVHGDFNRSNVLFNGDDPCVVDWTGATYAPLLDELCRALIEFVVLPQAKQDTLLNPSETLQGIDTFLRAYSRERCLSSQEKLELSDHLCKEAVGVGMRSVMIRDRYAPQELPEGGELFQHAVYAISGGSQLKSILDTLPRHHSQHTERQDFPGGRYY